jgi:hypothetical protein
VDYVTAIVPSLGVLFLFVLAIRAMFQADHRERLAQAQLERRERAGSAESGGSAGPSVEPTKGPVR